MWVSVLPHAGFSGVDVFLDHYSENKEAAIIMASAIEASHLIRPVLPSKSTLHFRFLTATQWLRTLC